VNHFRPMPNPLAYAGHYLHQQSLPEHTHSFM